MAPKRFRSYDNHDRYWTGFILLIIGTGLLLKKMDLGIPGWLFTWPMIPIIIGISIGFRNGFRNPAWLIVTGIGTLFLSDRIVDEGSFKPYFFPILVIGVGLLFLMRPKKKWHFDTKETGLGTEIPPALSLPPGPGNAQHTDPSGPNDTIDSVSIFSGVKKVVTSKNFKGGDIVCFMGGAEVDLTQADIQGPVVIELFQMFGGAKLVVPPHWEIRTSEAVAIFAGIEDKRHIQPGNFDPRKILIIKGVTIFGGIEIKSY